MIESIFRQIVCSRLTRDAGPKTTHIVVKTTQGKQFKENKYTWRRALLRLASPSRALALAGPTS